PVRALDQVPQSFQGVRMQHREALGPPHRHETIAIERLHLRKQSERAFRGLGPAILPPADPTLDRFEHRASNHLRVVKRPPSGRNSNSGVPAYGDVFVLRSRSTKSLKYPGFAKSFG